MDNRSNDQENGGKKNSKTTTKSIYYLTYIWKILHEGSISQHFFWTDRYSLKKRASLWKQMMEFSSSFASERKTSNFWSHSVKSLKGLNPILA